MLKNNGLRTKKRLVSELCCTAEVARTGAFSPAKTTVSGTPSGLRFQTFTNALKRRLHGQCTRIQESLGTDPHLT